MTNHYLIFLFTLVFSLSSLRPLASPQVPDYIIYMGDTIPTYNLILEQYLQSQEKTETGKLFGLSFRGGSPFNCWRGYQAIYVIANDSLYLVNIINCGEFRSGKIDKAASAEKMKAIFGGKLINDRVFINWFSGDINYPLNDHIIRWDGVFYKIFERERILSINNGKLLKVENVQNYVDDPKAIDRKDKNKVSDILFKRLKKVKWSNPDDCDCSDKYFITIDEAGNVSNVRMLYNPEEIEKYYDKGEYNYCVTTILNAVKKLNFDIIKDKGKPISEDIYIEIWITDKGKIENWTR